MKRNKNSMVPSITKAEAMHERAVQAKLYSDEVFIEYLKRVEQEIIKVADEGKFCYEITAENIKAVAKDLHCLPSEDFAKSLERVFNKNGYSTVLYGGNISIQWW